MGALVKLSTGRICLRQSRDEDLEAFAAMNSDARVMAFFRSRLSRVESDAMVDGIKKHFSEHGFGLWAIEVPDVAPFIGFAGLAVQLFSAHFTPCVEVGWRLAFKHWGHGYATEGARLALGYGFGTSRIVHIGDEPSFASRDGTAWDAPRSRRSFRLSQAPGRSSTPTACAIPPRFRFIFWNALNFRIWPVAPLTAMQHYTRSWGHC
jgi:RimJ/RimL family protein N-acetyltransferase